MEPNEKARIEKQLFEAIDLFTGGREVHTKHLVTQLLQMFEHEHSVMNERLAEQHRIALQTCEEFKRQIEEKDKEIEAVKQALRKQFFLMANMANFYFVGFSPATSIQKDLEQQYTKMKEEIENVLKNKITT